MAILEVFLEFGSTHSKAFQGHRSPFLMQEKKPCLNSGHFLKLKLNTRQPPYGSSLRYIYKGCKDLVLDGFYIDDALEKIGALDSSMWTSGTGLILT